MPRSKKGFVQGCQEWRDNTQNSPTTCPTHNAMPSHPAHRDEVRCATHHLIAWHVTSLQAIRCCGAVANQVSNKATKLLWPSFAVGWAPFQQQIGHDGASERAMRLKPTTLKTLALIHARTCEDHIPHRVSKNTIVRPLILRSQVEEIVLKAFRASAPGDCVKDREVCTFAQLLCLVFEVQPISDPEEERISCIALNPQAVQEEAIFSDEGGRSQYGGDGSRAGCSRQWRLRCRRRSHRGHAE
mmetsp:Transcript_37947/g.92224  ORF Transcript_37947/g.92224 Transcript_37947/m.92224 type:complete len:243 (-) Transcript_37947:14-742(-)